MRISPRIFAVGFGQNLAAFLAWSVIPVRAEFEAHAPAWQLGLLPVGSGIAYILVALRAGALSDRVGRGRLARIGMAGFAGFCVAASFVESVPLLSVLAILNGAALALVWPALQASIGDLSDAGDLERNLGEFSLSWSAGKTLGFFAFAPVYALLGSWALPLCGGLALAMVPLVPGGPETHAAGAPLVRDDHHPPALRAAHLRAGWWCNFASYGMGATLVYMYPALLRAAGRPESHHGWVLGSVYLAQTAGFVIFGRYAGWRYRFAPVAGWMAAGAAALLVIGLGSPLAAAIPAAAVLGLALGQAYAASVYYSVHSVESRGARAGIHEAVIGAADFGIPMLGGLAVTATEWKPAVFVLAAAVVAVALAMAARAVRATSPAPAALTGSTSPG
jgi:MFS family permease